MDSDGTKAGFDTNVTKAVRDSIEIPVIASGGAGNIEHFVDVFKSADADAALAASIFHFREVGIKELKSELKNQGINIRL